MQWCVINSWFSRINSLLLLNLYGIFKISREVQRICMGRVSTGGGIFWDSIGGCLRQGGVLMNSQVVGAFG